MTHHKMVTNSTIAHTSHPKKHNSTVPHGGIKHNATSVDKGNDISDYKDILMESIGSICHYFYNSYLVVKHGTYDFYKSLIKPLPILTEETEKSKYNIILVNFISPEGKSLLNTTIIPILQVCSFVLLVGLLIYVLKVLFVKKGANRPNFFIADDTTIPLKGRNKKVPNNVNYNELFNEKQKGVPRGSGLIARQEENLDEFLQKVQEKEEVTKILDNKYEAKPIARDTVVDIFDIHKGGEIISSNFNGDLMVFEKDLCRDDLFAKKLAPVPKDENNAGRFKFSGYSNSNKF
jgi:hypothetical protein